MADVSTNGTSESADDQGNFHAQFTTEEVRDNLLVLTGLALVSLLTGNRFDKKALAADMDPWVQELADRVTRRNEQQEVNDLAGGK